MASNKMEQETMQEYRIDAERALLERELGLLMQKTLQLENELYGIVQN